jgi:hypothetical protein
MRCEISWTRGCEGGGSCDAELQVVLTAASIGKDLEARKKTIFDIQRYATAQQCYLYLNSKYHHGLLAAVCEELRSPS